MGNYYSYAKEKTFPNVVNKNDKQHCDKDIDNIDDQMISPEQNPEQNISFEQKIINTRETLDYKYLVFSGGGVKGIAFCGVLKKLEELGILNNIKNYAGTSVGSIIACLLSVGYTSAEILQIFTEIDLVSLVDRDYVVKDPINLFSKYGVAKGKLLYKTIGDYIKMKTGDPDYTIEELYKEKGIKLVIVATNLSTRNSIYFYYDEGKKHSMIPIREAVRMSISIPFLFEPVIFDENIICDGGLLDNYPLHVFDGVNPDDVSSRMNLCVPNHQVLGINIVTESEMDGLISDKKYEIKSLYDYCKAIVDTFMIDNGRRTMSPSYWLRTINLYSPDYSLTNFSLTVEQKDELILIGEKHVDKFFNSVKCDVNESYANNIEKLN